MSIPPVHDQPHKSSGPAPKRKGQFLDEFPTENNSHPAPDEKPPGEEEDKVVRLPHYDPLPDDRLRLVLETGHVELVGRMPYSSNGTFLSHVRRGEDATPAIFKPAMAERPLRDFPPGLWQREVAAYELSLALEWHLVPMTVTREIDSLGLGSLQQFIQARFDEHYFTLVAKTEHHRALRRFCAFDLVANNTDRKGGHILVDCHKRLWGIDHGLCFGTHTRLRTVIWDFGGDELTEQERRALLAIADVPPAAFDNLLSFAEIDELRNRARLLAEVGALPFIPEHHRGYPWPML